MAFMDNLANAFSGFGAGVQGKGTEFMQQLALQDLGKKFANGEINQQQYLQSLAQTDPMAARRLAGVDTPSALQELAAYGSMTPEQQNTYWNIKRAAPVVNLGGSQAVLSPSGSGQPVANLPVTLKPEDQPINAGAKAEATAKGSATGGAQGTAEASLKDAQAYYPQLEQTVNQLKELGKVATYTEAGKAVNYLARQAGLEVPDAANAREKYKTTVSDVLLPQLRQTFGAQFTEKEGERLQATLGDPDKSPSEKQAALDSFIEQKKKTIESMQRRTGESSSAASETPITKTINGVTYTFKDGKWYQ